MGRKRNIVRTGKRLKLQEYKSIKTIIHILSLSNFKTLQFTLTGWIKIDDVTQDELNKSLAKTKLNIKNTIRLIARKTKRFQQESIVIINTGQVSSLRKNYQFFEIEICLFNLNLKYERSVVLSDIELLSKLIIDNDIDTSVFQFLQGKVRGTGQLVG